MTINPSGEMLTGLYEQPAANFPVVPSYNDEHGTCDQCGHLVAHLTEPHPVTKQAILVPGALTDEDGRWRGLCGCSG